MKFVESDKKIVDFDKRVKENEFKVVQIVAMFVSIATFVLINVKIFDNKSGIESFAIILGLTACFFAFNIFFYLIIYVRNEKKEIDKRVDWNYWKKLIAILLLPTFFASFSAIILYSEDGKNEKLIKHLQDRVKLDSINIEKVLSNPLFYSAKDTVYVYPTVKSPKKR